MIDETMLQVATLPNERSNCCVRRRKREDTTRKISKREVYHKVNTEDWGSTDTHRERDL